MKHKLCTAAVCIGMLLALALPAWAAEYGEANITPQTTMNELRENPSIVGSGLYTYSREQDCTLKQAYWGTQELEKFSNQWTAQDAAEGLNQLIRNYNAGIQITYPLYTAEEIAQDTSRDVVELYYFPAQGETKNRKYALVLGGNALITSAEIREGISTAWQMNQMGYTTFVLRYRIGIRAGGNAPMEDVARAVQYITAHAEQFDVQPDIVSAAKGLGGGLPIGAVLMNEKVAEGMGPGTHGSTFGGNPVVCAGANVVVDRLDQSFLAQVSERAVQLRTGLAKLPHVKNISGIGLMVGIEFFDVQAADVLAACREKGLLVLTAKTRLRLLPPLTVSEHEVDMALEVLAEVLGTMEPTAPKEQA